MGKDRAGRCSGVNKGIQETNLWLPNGEGGKEGRNRSIGLPDTNYHTQNRQATRINHTAQGTTANVL